MDTLVHEFWQQYSVPCKIFYFLIIIIFFYIHRPSTFLKQVYVVGNLMNHASKERSTFSVCTKTYVFMELYKY